MNFKTILSDINNIIIAVDKMNSVTDIINKTVIPDYTTELYKLYNTNIHERIAEMKAKEGGKLSEKTD
jgi:hypothetical protein